MVYAVVGGQPVDAFSGVVPEAQLRQWLQAVLKAGGVAVAEPEDPRLDEADDALISGDLDAAEQAYRKILADAPADAAAEAGLAQVGLARRVAGRRPGHGAGRRREPPPTTSPPNCSPPTSRCSAAWPSRRTRGSSVWSGAPPVRIARRYASTWSRCSPSPAPTTRRSPRRVGPGQRAVLSS